MRFDATGGGRFVEVMLMPRVTIAAGSDAALAEALHREAHETCYVAGSCNTTIRHLATIATA